MNLFGMTQCWSDLPSISCLVQSHRHRLVILFSICTNCLNFLITRLPFVSSHYSLFIHLRSIDFIYLEHRFLILTASIFSWTLYSSYLMDSCFSRARGYLSFTLSSQDPQIWTLSSNTPSHLSKLLTHKHPFKLQTRTRKSTLQISYWQFAMSSCGVAKRKIPTLRADDQTPTLSLAEWLILTRPHSSLNLFIHK